MGRKGGTGTRIATGFQLIYIYIIYIYIIYIYIYNMTIYLCTVGCVRAEGPG